MHDDHQDEFEHHRQVSRPADHAVGLRVRLLNGVLKEHRAEVQEPDDLKSHDSDDQPDLRRFPHDGGLSASFPNVTVVEEDDECD